jgi:hypothetical protein
MFSPSTAAAEGFPSAKSVDENKVKTAPKQAAVKNVIFADLSIALFTSKMVFERTSVYGFGESVCRAEGLDC